MTSVEMVEVGPRDGLQNEKASFTTEQKLMFIERALRIWP
jgi:isopropylmalate/homocitrate/citramalate synthase